jgi:Fe-Mn family superoxide dismutase
LINGLKREELIAMNSMILHELFFDGLGDLSEPASPLKHGGRNDQGRDRHIDGSGDGTEG